MSKQLDEMEQLLCVYVTPLQMKLDKASKLIDKLGVRLDPMLDKPMDDGNPKYACGDALEEVKQVVDYAYREIYDLKRHVLACSAAWGAYPDEDDDKYRTGCYYGFLKAMER